MSNNTTFLSLTATAHLSSLFSSTILVSKVSPVSVSQKFKYKWNPRADEWTEYPVNIIICKVFFCLQSSRNLRLTVKRFTAKYSNPLKYETKKKIDRITNDSNVNVQIVFIMRKL